MFGKFKLFFIRFAITFILSYLLNNTRIMDLLQLIQDAAREQTNDFARRGQVYRALKEREGEGAQTQVLNVAVELGLLLAQLKR